MHSKHYTTFITFQTKLKKSCSSRFAGLNYLCGFWPKIIALIPSPETSIFTRGFIGNVSPGIRSGRLLVCTRPPRHRYHLICPRQLPDATAKAATSDPSLLLRGVYCRGPGICRRQIQPINISAIIPLDAFWGFIVGLAVNSVEGKQGHVSRAVMVCLSRLGFKRPNIYPKYWNRGLKITQDESEPWIHV